MGRFDFVSPGAAVTDALTQLVTKRKTEERQAMLDQLSQNADMRAASSAIDQHAESESQRASNEVNRKRATQQAELERMNAAFSNLRRGDDPNKLGMSPDLIELGQKYNQFDVKDDDVPQAAPALVEGGDESNGGVAPQAPMPAPAPKKTTHLSYRGSDKERQEEADRREVGNFITSMVTSNDPEQRQAGQVLARMASANHGEIPKEGFSVLQPYAPFFNYNEETGRLTNTGQRLPANAVVKEQPRPYRDPTPRSPIYAGDTTDGGTKWLMPDNKIMIIPGATRKTQPKTPDPNAAISLGIKPQTAQTYIAMSSDFANSPDDDVKAANTRRAAMSVINEAKVTPAVRALATKYIDSAEAWKAAAPEADSLSEADYSTLVALIKFLGNK